MKHREPEIDETETEDSGSTENVQLPENGLQCLDMVILHRSLQRQMRKQQRNSSLPKTI